MSWRIFKVFSGHRELLDSGLCDVVIVSTPNMTHYKILMDIINHPKPHHVLVEKPLCTTVADCKEVGFSSGIYRITQFTGITKNAGFIWEMHC